MAIEAPRGRRAAIGTSRRVRKAGDLWEQLSPIHLVIILAVIVLLFGGKKIPEVMRGLGEGIRNFKDGMNAPHPTTPSANPPANPPAAAPTVPPSPAASEEKK